MRRFFGHGLLLTMLGACGGWLTAQAAAPSVPQGMITARQFLDIGGDPAVASLTSSPKFPNAPDALDYPALFEWPSNPDGSFPPSDFKNNYGVQLVGYLYPPVTGDYVFAIASDDQSELFLSTDENPANKVLIAREPQWNPIRAFGSEARRKRVDAGTPDERRENVSRKIRLTAGRPCYIEALLKEGPGAENLAVAWAKPGERWPQDGDAPIPGSFLATIDRTNLGGAYVAGFSYNYVGIQFLLEDGAGAGAVTVNPNSIRLSFDGSEVAPRIVRTGTTTTAIYDPAEFLAANSQHAARIEFADTRGARQTVEQTFTVESYLTLPGGFAVTGVDTNKPGFRVRVYQVVAGQPDTLAWAEEELAGLHGENIADLSGAGRDGYFVLEDVINLSQSAGENNGNFRPDLQMPGIPGLDGGDDNVAMEILTFLDLPKGVITMGVNSDDGFRVSSTSGANDVFAVHLGEFNGGRGASDTLFTFVVPAAGIYPFRVLYEQGTGGASIEWFTVAPDGKKILINDRASAGAIKAYREGPAGGSAYLQSVTPPIDSQDQPAAVRIGAVLIDGANKIDPSLVQLGVDGAGVAATVFKSGNRTTVNYVPAVRFIEGSKHSVALTYGDNSSPPAARTVEWSFSTRITEATLAAGTLFIEAEDFDFGRGQFILDEPIGMNGRYAGGAYRDQGDGIGGIGGDGSGFGIDYFEVNPGNDQAVYRPTTAVEAGMGGTTLDPPPSGLNRGAFVVKVNHVVGWNDAGDWYNYTREFPQWPRAYAVYARLSSGASAEAAQLDEVISGVRTANQKLKKLGTFRAPATGAWDSFHIVQLKDEAGHPALVTLNGFRTLRFTVLPGNLDVDYLAFVPVPAPPGGAAFRSIERLATFVVIEWMGTARLQVAGDLAGPWTDVVGAESPLTLPTGSESRFFRLVP